MTFEGGSSEAHLFPESKAVMIDQGPETDQKVSMALTSSALLRRCRIASTTAACRSSDVQFRDVKPFHAGGGHSCSMSPELAKVLKTDTVTQVVVYKGPWLPRRTHMLLRIYNGVI